ncbi:protein FAR1-RELATED SEQUENCE 5-like [Senna tora]|uniref:Protein FAR1-RELATED SEQUENCE 5-like n=1 Tax=Senna tora TaxID=362788 RepID=A0A834X909_9FABA|nr:protein FAR1-RELATED SEQUENCE 5-like [Senna tora]
MGFGVRRLFTNKSKKDGSITTCRFVCCKEGVRRANKGVHNVVNRRQETRTDCTVKMGLVNEDGKFKVYDLVEEHNHVLHLPNTTHMLPSHRRISDVQAQEIELVADSGLQQRAAYEFLSREAGGRGFNHFKGGVISGAALLYDETTVSFKWLFETFLKANLQKRPQTIFTDQDQAMAKALREVMPEVYHGLCTWHLMQNGIKHLGNLMKGGSHFLRDFKSFAKVYTPPIFDEFQYEFNISLACSIKYKHESEAGFEYGIIIVGREVEFRVLFNPPQKAVSYSCKRFENFGLNDLRKQAEELLEREKDVNNFRDDSIPPMSACTSQPMSASSSQPMGASSSQPKGIKKRQGNKRTRCYKNWVGQRKRTQRVPNSHSQRSIEPLNLSTLSLGGFQLDGDNSNVHDQASQQS